MVVGIGFQLTITGSGFMQGSVVNFGTQQLATTFISPTQLTATGTATAAQVGNIAITVTNPNPVSATSAAIRPSRRQLEYQRFVTPKTDDRRWKHNAIPGHGDRHDKLG